MDDLNAARAARSLPQNLFGGANRYTPSPLSRRRYSSGVCLNGGCLGARPAWSAPPSPCARGSAARAGRLRLLLRLLRVRAPPPSRPSPRLAGAGGFQLGVAPLALRLSWARAMRPQLGLVAGLPLRPAALGRESAPPASAACRLRMLPCRPWAQAALRLCPPPQSCPLPRAAATRYSSPRCKNPSKTHQKSIKKRQKARFLCGISPQASLYASTDSTLISPTNGAYWAAVDAARSQKRYFKPSHMVGGRSPWGGGAKPQFCN